MGSTNFRVVIAGGSIAGLSLALMLEKNGIDFVVLDAYPEIAPQLGASIALRPNGFRIMDQLGAYEDVLRCGQYPVDEFLIHDPSGKPLVGAKNLRRESVDRYGYPVLFFTRRELVQILYDHIKSKDKILTSKRVKRVDETDDKVTVTTEDGQVFEGDLVVGADGMHSAVRQEIERKSPNQAALRTETLPANFGGVFGTSNSDLRSPKGSVIICAGKESSLYVAAGPDDTTFWMVFFKLDKTYYGRDVPCRGAKAEEEYSKKYWDHPITGDYKYSDLRKTAIVSVCTPLHEYVVENWHSGRCVIIGDSAHKVNPVGAQGGNAALESAAALTNGIMKLLQSKGPDGIPREKFDSILEDVQNLRKPRTSFLCKKSMDMQEVVAETSPFYKMMNRYIMPFLGENAMLEDICEGYPTAVSLESLPIPSRPRSAPFFDELICQPKARSIPLTVLVSTILIGLGALGFYLLPGLSGTNGTFRLVQSAVATSFLQELHIPLQSLVDADQFPGLDKLCKTLVAAFLPTVSGEADLGSKIQAAYFLIGVYLPLLSIIAIEGYRYNNKGTLLWSPSLWTGLAQFLGLGVVLPFYLLAVFFTSRKPDYWMAYSQAAPAHKVKALLPCVILAYLTPSLAMLSLPATSPLIQPAIALWQASPVLVIGATELLSRALATPPNPKATAITSTSTVSVRPEPYLTGEPHRAPVDLAPPRRLQAAAAVLSATAHVALVLYTVSSPHLSLAATFLPPSLAAATSDDDDLAATVPTIARGMSLFLRLDLLLVLAGALLWSLLTLHDLRRVGLAATGLGARSVGLLLAGWVLAGPGAATALLWAWREGVVGGFVPRRMVVAAGAGAKVGAVSGEGNGVVVEKKKKGGGEKDGVVDYAWYY
ncbi:hypothetical protein SLS58_000108 [Diplodia intermedia]|uniref:FAD-binding domain-containing protein n=1 Tax=Diplodia intermedia TaxID=856260 RepID=A0ABR3U4S5_9PEZI